MLTPRPTKDTLYLVSTNLLRHRTIRVLHMYMYSINERLDVFKLDFFCSCITQRWTEVYIGTEGRRFQMFVLDTLKTCLPQLLDFNEESGICTMMKPAADRAEALSADGNDNLTIVFSQYQGAFLPSYLNGPG